MTSATRTLVVCLAMVSQAYAQKFEVADIHPSARTTGIRLPGINSEMRGGFTRDGRYELHAATMADLIGVAWGLDIFKVVGGPAWVDHDRFEVIAKIPVGTTTETLRAMLQALLVERFGLVVHKDTRPFPQYALTAGKHPLLKQAAGNGVSECQAPPPSAQNSASVACHNMTMAEFAGRLPRLARNYFQASPVEYLTGIEGAWDFTLHFTDRNSLAATGAEGLTIFSAVEKQLGLKLEVQQVPTPVVVIDGVNERPADNPPGVSQSLPALPTRFEVADIKPSAPGSTQKGFRAGPGGRVDVRGFTLKELIKFAWELQDLDAIDNDDMLVGAPKWLDRDRFDIVAEVSGSGSKTGPGLDMDSARLMLRSLLADRFKLATHMEEQPVAVYAMTAAKAKLKKADPSGRAACRNAPSASDWVPIFSLTCQNTTMAQLAEELPAFGGLYVVRPVIDATGLEGGWDFALSWSPPHLVKGGEAAADPNGGLTIIEALDKQLGLKLEARKHAMPVVVIDHVEREPTEN